MPHDMVLVKQILMFGVSYYIYVLKSINPLEAVVSLCTFTHTSFEEENCSIKIRTLEVKHFMWLK